jgi:pimeloyl-ACP methyl ester carboxylesterase
MSPLFGVSFGGEGNFNDYWSARSMYSAGRKKIPWANMVYDNERGLNFVDMARVLQAAQKQRQFQYLIVDGDSLGGMFGMYAALLANIPVAGFMADSSPMRLSDAVRSAVITADFVTRAPKSEFVETLELGAKDLYCDVRDQGVEDFVANLANNISSLPSQMAQGASPQLQRDQLGWAGIIDMSNLAHLYRERGIIQAGITQPIFLRAAHDGVIRPETAYADWKGWFASEFDIRMPLLQMRPGSGHADVFAAATCVQAEGYLDYLIHQFRSPTMVIE